MQHTTVLRDFVRHLQNNEPDLSQAEIARRTDISQALINKIAIGGGPRVPHAETFAKLTAGYQQQWNVFISSRAETVQELLRSFSWLEPVFAVGQAVGEPELSEAVGLLRRIFRNRNHWQLVLQQLRAWAEFPGGEQQPRPRRRAAGRT